jgi:hypothetical protein
MSLGGVEVEEIRTEVQVLALAAEVRKKAVVAVAHGLLLRVYQVLQSQRPQAPAPPIDEQRRKRIVPHHLRSLGRLGISTGPKRISAAGVAAKLGRPRKAKT